VIVEAQVTIRGSRAAIWAAITDLENAATTIRGIEKIEILERPANGLVGLRWNETRILFGDPATVEKRITKAVEGWFYSTSAESDGFVFVTTRSLGEGDGALTLTESHESRPQNLGARLRMIPMALFFRGVVRKAVLQDLEDLKAAVERG
jgi:hypothetical protein